MEPENQSIVRVYERVLDMLLLEEFCVSKPFQTWWLEQMGISWAGEHTFVEAHRSVIDLGRESDLVLKVDAPSGDRLAVLIEDKIAADAQPEQSLGYRKRGKEGIARGNWHQFVTCIVAPDWYLRAGPDVGGYDRTISVESVRDWLSTSGMDPARREFKLQILKAIIDVPSREPFPPQPWDRDAFLAALGETVGADAVLIADGLIGWAERVGISLDRGTARKPQVGFLHPRRFRLFTLVVDGKVQVHFPNISGTADAAGVRQKLFDSLNRIPGVQFAPEALEKPYQNFPLTALTPPSSLQAFLSAMESTLGR